MYVYALMSVNIDNIVISILKSFLGSPRSEYGADTRTQWEFNCPSPTCRNDVNKYNLNYNSPKRIFHCFKCKYSGFVHKVVRDYGGKENYEKLNLFLPYDDLGFNIFKKPQVNYDNITCEWPDDYRILSKNWGTYLYKQALNYLLYERKLTLNEIEKYKIGYTETGNRRFRIIIPSFNKNNNLNYYEARKYLKNINPVYLKPKEPDKNLIIFNEKNINWDLPIFLVEGVFDMFRIPNSIPMLGKKPSDLLLQKIIKYSKHVVICIDEDAFSDAYELYSLLISLDIDVYLVDMKGKDDISKVYEKNGIEAIYKLLKTKKKIDFESYINKILT